ncbi:MAG: four-carbon acid sugar kinase family protein [Candidatus Rokubacteria bacterium]|nr:four-carbon acid sugar kinase family protein [Candidatus Rokubacteria bacterium]
MIRAGIQADDLTGACDTGGAFAARGLPTLVLLPDTAIPSPPPEILVLDTESRGRPASEARAQAHAAAVQLAARSPALLYKKVDSTLRGAVAAELGGALEGAGRLRVILAPAFPAQGRTVVEGILRIDDRPATETAIARDPGFPPTGASVLALLGVGGPHPVSPVPLATVRRGPAAVATRLARSTGSLVCDAESDADLAVLATATEGIPSLLAGSTGFATALAARLTGVSAQPAARPRRPLLVVSGSAHPATRAQMARLETRGLPGTWLGSETADDRLAPGGAFLAAYPEPANTDTPGREAMAVRLAEATRQRLERDAPRTLLLTGGETAYSVCRALGVTGIALAGQVEPGLAIGALLGGPFAGLGVITKAGGFGDPDTLVRVYEGATR